MRFYPMAVSRDSRRYFTGEFRVSQQNDTSADHAPVYTELKNMVREYRFRPGEQLLIGELAARLRVSSTPVREALVRLQAEHLLAPASRRGFFMKLLTCQDMIDLHECIFLILKHAVETPRGAPDTSIFEAWLSIPTQVGDNAGDAIVPADAGHWALCVETALERVASLSRNQIMLCTARNIIDRTHYVRLIDLEAEHRRCCASQAIDDLRHALLQNDARGAVAVLERDLNGRITNMPALVREGVSRAHMSNASTGRDERSNMLPAGARERAG